MFASVHLADVSLETRERSETPQGQGSRERNWEAICEGKRIPFFSGRAGALYY